LFDISNWFLCPLVGEIIFQQQSTQRTLAAWRRPTCRNGREVFSNINLSVAQGKLVAVTGGAGSGKSKLLNVLAGDASWKNKPGVVVSFFYVHPYLGK